MLKGTIRITFGQDDFTVNPNYRAAVLDAMISQAAEYHMAWTYKAVKAAILKGYPDIEVVTGGVVEDLLFTLYSECFTFTFDGGVEHIKECWKWIFQRQPELITDRVMEAARLFHQYGVEDVSTFRATYGLYFEQALDANLYAPNYAFIQACVSAGFDLDKWAAYDDGPLAWYGYFSPSVAKAS
jgi:hypothetical protein